MLALDMVGGPAPARAMRLRPCGALLASLLACLLAQGARHCLGMPCLASPGLAWPRLHIRLQQGLPRACLLHLPQPPRRLLPGLSPQDGTLLDSRSRVLPSSVAAIKAAMARGVTVFLATGKARPAAICAMQAVGLAGEGLVVSTRGPGIFLQGGCWLGACRAGSSPAACRLRALPWLV